MARVSGRECRCPMKVVRMVCFIALLMAFAATQSSVAQSGVSSDQSQAQNPNQPPQSPLQEQPTGIAAEQQQQQQAQRSGQQSHFETPTALGEDQQLGEIRLMSRYTEVNGDETRSFREPGMNNLAEFNYFMDRRFGVTRRVQTLSMFRATDDHSIDPERNSVQKAFVRIYGQRDEYIFGDALVNYSRLTFNQNVKGVSASWKFGNRWQLSTVGGVFVDRWGSFYKEMEGRPFTSRVAGSRLQFTPSKDVIFGVNFSSSDDLLGSLPFAEVGTSPLPASNRVGSLDLKVQKRAFRFDSEFAYSGTDFDTRDGSGICAGVICDGRQPQNNLGYQTGWGGRAEASYRYKRLTLRGSYVRFQPNFASINARQISDLQDALGRISVDTTDWLTVEGTIRRSNNDLKDQLTYQTTQLQPEGRFIFHDLPFYRRGVFEIGYRHRFTYSGNKTGPTVPDIDRFVRMPYAEFTVPVGTTFLSFGYERRMAVDLISPSQTSNTNRYYMGLRGVYDLGGWHINPAFRYELERQSQRPDLEKAIDQLDLLNYPFLTPDHLDYGSNRLGTASLLVEPPKWFIVELAFRDSSSTLFGPLGYSRPSYRAQVTYKFFNDENILLIASFERNSNFYLRPANQNTIADFDERMAGLSIVYKFGKRGR